MSINARKPGWSQASSSSALKLQSTLLTQLT
uniref:Uncharacterized protein n=1 Tax=Rhizophora mucronata TaxID=61149 RepID=A0A2P2QBU9_RHIMU